MEDGIEKGIKEEDPNVAVKILNGARSDKNEILTNDVRSKGVLVGTSTMNNVMMPQIDGLVAEMNWLRSPYNVARAFGPQPRTPAAMDLPATRVPDAAL